MKKVKFAAYNLNSVTQTLNNQYKEGKPKKAGLLDWEKFKATFLDCFFTFEMRKEKVLEFINVRQIRAYILNLVEVSSHPRVLKEIPLMYRYMYKSYL